MSRANGHKDRQARRWVRDQQCLICGTSPCDPHHYPTTVARGAGDDIEEMVPLCRCCHDLAHRGERWVLDALASVYPEWLEYVRGVKLCSTRPSSTPTR